MSATSFAVLTKARSKFGKRLTENDYSSLLACQSVTEVMSYLKSYTPYSRALRDVNERDVHRGQLEMLLRQNLFYNIDSLCRYDLGMGMGFSSYIIENTEAELIMRFLTLLNLRSTEKFIFQFPSFFSKHTEIDEKRLAIAKNYDEFLNVLKNSKYYHILSRFKPNGKGILPISEIENELYTFVFKNLMTVITKKTSGKEREELKSLFITINRYNNFSRILRLKKYYNLPPEEIRRSLMFPFDDCNGSVIDRMCAAESSAEIFSIMEETHEGKLINKIGYVYASDITPRVRYRLARKNMYFSNIPSVVMISYMFVSEIELSNIITLIEGARYKLDSKIIRSLLIY